jgi:hypothetical protein
VVFPEYFWFRAKRRYFDNCVERSATAAAERRCRLRASIEM